MSRTVADVPLTQRRHVLLDFDGPVCSVFGGIPDHEVAEALRQELTAVGALPESVLSSPDPFVVLDHARAVCPDATAHVERRLTELETRAVARAEPTSGAVELLHRLTDAGRVVTVVSNNSEAAVRAYLRAHDLDHLVAGISARTSADVTRLKPHPYLLHQAMQHRAATPEQCVMIGDSVTDAAAAHAAGTAVIAYANKPGKRDAFRAYQPDAIVGELAEVPALLLRPS